MRFCKLLLLLLVLIFSACTTPVTTCNEVLYSYYQSKRGDTCTAITECSLCIDTSKKTIHPRTTEETVQPIEPESKNEI